MRLFLSGLGDRCRPQLLRLFSSNPLEFKSDLFSMKRLTVFACHTVAFAGFEVGFSFVLDLSTGSLEFT